MRPRICGTTNIQNTAIFSQIFIITLIYRNSLLKLESELQWYSYKYQMFQSKIIQIYQNSDTLCDQNPKSSESQFLEWLISEYRKVIFPIQFIPKIILQIPPINQITISAISEFVAKSPINSNILQILPLIRIFSQKYQN